MTSNKQESGNRGIHPAQIFPGDLSLASARFFFAVEDEEDEVRRSAVKTVVGVILAPPQLRDGPQ